MKKVIVVAGGTGNLGEKIVKNLLQKGAEVRVLVRSESDINKINHLKSIGAEVLMVDMSDITALSAVCKNADCVVSALSGLREVIIDTQIVLLDAAVAAGVPRFIPSDYSLDFTKFSAGENRNLDWRREFHQYLDKKPIAATTIFNGAFADMLTNEMPLILFKQKMVLYWGKADHKMGFTTVADTAIFTANAALDAKTPRFLRIAGDQISPQEIKTAVKEVTGTDFRMFRPGGLGLLSTIIKIARFIAPAKTQLYPAWQGMQYMRNMIDDRSNMNKLDNERYPNMRWTTVQDVISAYSTS